MAKTATKHLSSASSAAKHAMATLASSSTNNTPARWNLVVSEQTNIAVCNFLVLKGFKKADLSSFMEEPLSEARAEGLTAARYTAFSAKSSSVLTVKKA